VFSQLISSFLTGSFVVASSAIGATSGCADFPCWDPVSGHGIRATDLIGKVCATSRLSAFMQANCTTWDSAARWRARRWPTRTNHMIGGSSPISARYYWHRPTAAQLAIRLASIWSRVCMLWIRHHRGLLAVVVSVGEVSPAQAAVKMHTLLDLHGNIPTFIRVRA